MVILWTVVQLLHCGHAVTQNDRTLRVSPPTNIMKGPCGGIHSHFGLQLVRVYSGQGEYLYSSIYFGDVDR